MVRRKLFMALFILLILFNVFDVVATRHVLETQTGKNNLEWIEYNPIMNYIMENHGYVGVSFLKMFFVLLLGTLLLIYEKQNRVIPLMLCATVPYGILVGWEIYIIFFLL